MGQPKIKKVAYSQSQRIGAIAGIIGFFLCYSVIPFSGLSQEGRGVLATLILMGFWWIFEVADAGVVGLLPLVIFPITKSLGAAATAAAYGSNTVFMFLGGFALSQALEKWNLHKRIALATIDRIGTSINRLVVGLMLVGCFISMWVSNIATILILLPIALVIADTITELASQEAGKPYEFADRIRKKFILAVGFGAIIGGSMTLIGTPTNIALAGLSLELLGYELSFVKFLVFEFPIALIQFLVMCFFLTKVIYPVDISDRDFAKEMIRNERRALGKMSPEEKTVSVVFVTAVLLWVCQRLVASLIPAISDTVISIAVCVVLFMLPDHSGKRILNSDAVRNMPWTTILMLMGGMAVAAGFSGTDLSAWIGEQMLGLSGQPEFVSIFLMTLTGLLVTQFAPNTATSAVLLPITVPLAQAIGMEHIALMTACALACGFSCTIPTGTPVMGVIYGTGEYTMPEVVKSGLILAVVSAIMIPVLCLTWLPVILQL